MGSGLGGSRLGAALFAVGLVALLPVHDAYADRARRPVRAASKAKAKAIVPATPAAALSLAGTYALTSVSMRPVRDVELAKSQITFSPGGDVSVKTACNAMGARLQSRSKPGEILGFSNPAQTLLPCQGKVLQAETTTSRLMAETANIARAGNIVTFFNANGINIAQWTLVAATAPEVSAPQPGAPPPVRADFGDYVLTELNRVPIAGYAARPVPTPSGMPAGPEAAPPTLPANTRLASRVPNLFLRANGSVMGSSGCNQFNATLVDNSDGTRRFGPVGATKKGCLNRNTRTIETQLFTAFRTATRVEAGPRRIDLFARNGVRIARFASIGARTEAGPSLYGTNWILRSFNGSLIPQVVQPTIKFEGNRASGSTGCNRFDIQHIRQNGGSRFSNGITTRMACMDDNRNALESRYMAALETITNIEISPTTLTLRSADSRTVLMFDAE
jgi:heat shock protein HslJ